MASAFPGPSRASVEVQVTDTLGYPLVDVVVHRVQTNELQIPPTGDQITTIAVTGSDGLIMTDTSGTKSLILFSRDGFATRAFDAQKPLPSRVLLYQETMIAGTVVDSNGTSVPNALIGPVQPTESEEGVQVSLPEEKPVLPPVWTRTDQSGSFRVRSLHPGYYNFLVSADGLAPQMAAVATGDETSITLSNVGTTCTGVLTGSRDGLLQHGIWVEAASAVFLPNETVFADRR